MSLREIMLGMSTFFSVIHLELIFWQIFHPLPQDMFCQSRQKLGQIFIRSKVFTFALSIFSIFPARVKSGSGLYEWADPGFSKGLDPDFIPDPQLLHFL